MAENVVYVRGTRDQVRRAIVLAAAAAAGNTQDARDAADAMQVRVGMAALGHIRDAFVVKARGGTDEAGLKWPPLSPKTIAYGRRHPGVPPARQRAWFAPSWMLTAKQRSDWWTAYRAGLAMFAGDRAKAGARAWGIAKRGGAKTLLQEFGATAVEILRDTGLLLNSLSPGVSPGSVEHQVFRIGPGEVIVGTNRKWAGVHHRGNSRIPQRRLWPEPSQWPASWWQDITQQAREGYIEVLLFFLRQRT